MPNKEEALKYIETLAAQRIITKEELLAAYTEGGVKTDRVFTKKLGVVEILYYIGGAIVFLGLLILVWQNWSTLSTFTKILATFGSGIAAYLTGFLFGRAEKTETISAAFYLISALVTPIGLYIIFDSAGFDANSYGSRSLISGILLVNYILSFFLLRKGVFVLFSIIFGTLFFFAFTNFMVGDSPIFDGLKFFEYRMLVAGIAYILFGYSFLRNERAPLSGFLYGFGILGFLGAALALGGWEPNQTAFWELMFPGLVFGTLFLSIYLKSKAFLTFSTLYLMAYILKITAEYFSKGLGWPFALVSAGLMLIAVGYLAFRLKEKYLLA